MATIFGFLYMGCTLAPPEEYDWTAHVWRRCGLMSNYFDHLLLPSLSSPSSYYHVRICHTRSWCLSSQPYSLRLFYDGPDAPPKQNYSGFCCRLDAIHAAQPTVPNRHGYIHWADYIIPRAEAKVTIRLAPQTPTQFWQPFVRCTMQ